MNKFILMEEIINMERWTKEEEQYLIENYMTEMYCDIARKINKTENAVRAKCFELRLVKKNSWTQDEIDFIKENYQKLSIKQIAKILNRTENAVKLKAAKNGCKRSPYYCDYSFFNTIDTEQKAYWFGFIAADGWININKETNSGVVGIELQASDIDHLKKFNRDINGNYQIKTRTRECKISTKQGSISEECNIRIFSIDMVNDLINHGITSSKTHEFQFPTLRDDLMSHFIRGYFDGDGCVRTRARRLSSGQVIEYPVCDIVSANQKFLDDLRAFLYEKYDICSYIYAEKSGCYRLYVHKNEHTIKFLNFMYKNSTVYLDRKYKIYLNIVKNNTTNDGLAV